MYWDPFEEMRRIQERLDRLMDRMWRRVEREEAREFREPLMDMVDRGDEIVLVFEIPGLSKEDIDVSVTEDTVTVRGEKRREEGREGEGYVYRERAYTSFYRTVRLPVKVVPEKTRATYKNGILEIVLKKAEAEGKGYRVKVE